MLSVGRRPPQTTSHLTLLLVLGVVCLLWYSVLSLLLSGSRLASLGKRCYVDVSDIATLLTVSLFCLDYYLEDKVSTFAILLLKTSMCEE